MKGVYYERTFAVLPAVSCVATQRDATQPWGALRAEHHHGAGCLASFGFVHQTGRTSSRLPMLPLSPLPQDAHGPSPVPMPRSLIYALSCEYFRRPLLEPQVGGSRGMCGGREACVLSPSGRCCGSRRWGRGGMRIKNEVHVCGLLQEVAAGALCRCVFKGPKLSGAPASRACGLWAPCG